MTACTCAASLVPWRLALAVATGVAIGVGAWWLPVWLGAADILSSCAETIALLLLFHASST